MEGKLKHVKSKQTIKFTVVIEWMAPPLNDGVYPSTKVRAGSSPSRIGTGRPAYLNSGKIYGGFAKDGFEF